ncbi:MAG: hemerythrin domain-containing protein [Chloroflexi bacterium]|nr:hemerythrin domain-containing protein [Chloroflexota bacterium]
MAEEITRLDSPIDMMLLMHKAFVALSERTEALAAQAQQGGDLDAFTEAFGFWGKQLLYHATAEDKYMTGPFTDSQPARDNETEHVELARQATDLVGFLEKGDSAGLKESVRAAMFALEEEQHKEVVEKLEAVEEVLAEEMGHDRIVARTRRHLYSRVMALRVTEYDHFENEEAFVVSLVRDEMTEQQQLEVARHLLIEDEAEDPRWIIDWVASELSPGEERLLADLEARFQPVA